MQKPSDLIVIEGLCSKMPFTVALPILTLKYLRIGLNYFVKVEAIIGKNDEAIMNFEKVSRVIYFFIIKREN